MITLFKVKRVALLSTSTAFQKGPLSEHKQIKRSQLFDAGGKPEYPEEKNSWTGNQMDVQRWPGIEPGLSGPRRRRSTAKLAPSPCKRGIDLQRGSVKISTSGG